MTYFIAVLRLAVAGLGVAAVITSQQVTEARGNFDPVNFFSLFTIVSTLLTVVVMLMSAGAHLSGRSQGTRLTFLRGAVTSYMVVVGIVYAALLEPIDRASGIPIGWENTAMHVIIPVVLAADWMFVSDRRRLPWKRVWAFLVFPLVWTAMALVRGATDGWVPYPFLDPAGGYPMVAAYVALIAAGFAASALLVILISHRRGGLVQVKP